MSWRIIGASVPGTIHIKKQIPCQDAYCFKVMPHNQAVIAIADGAGFAERSGEGAKMAVRQAVISMAHYVQKYAKSESVRWENVMNLAFAETRERLLKAASTIGQTSEAFSTTLTIVYAFDHGLVVGQLGDGLVIGETLAGSLFLAAMPQRGEYANQSIFITKSDALDFLKVETYDQPVQSMALITDGLLRLAVGLPGYHPYEPFFRPLLEFASENNDTESTQSQLDEFLMSPRVCNRTDDDKTLVLAIRTKPIRHGMRSVAAAHSDHLEGN